MQEIKAISQIGLFISWASRYCLLDLNNTK
jgi:hypothetical protein